MKRFARLYQELDETTKTNERVQSLVRYFREVEPADAAWAVWFLCGQKPKRVIKVRELQQWCAELSGIPEWLFETSREFVGDLAETIALLLPVPDDSSSESLGSWIENRLLPLASLTETARRESIQQAWRQLSPPERLVFNKLITGGFRVGVSQKLVIRALADYSGIGADVIAHRLMGHWQPTASFFLTLNDPDTSDTVISRPYPFCLAHALSDESAAGLFDNVGLVAESSPTLHEAELKSPEEWFAEWKWDGIRAQIIYRAGQVFIWSRGEELLTERFPELEQAARRLPPGTVLDGEIVGWRNAQVLTFPELQKRIQRKTAGPALRASVPVRFLAFDLLESDGRDIRGRPLSERRLRLESLGLAPLEVYQESLCLPRRLTARTFADCCALRAASREQSVEGLMLKHADSVYEVGRVTGVWWKWKNEPFHCDAVLLYAQRGHGRRAGRFTDFTFAVWDNGQLVPFAKAYSGLTNAEIEEIDRFVKDNTTERFGPVHSVRAELVFELAFENIQLSSRHKSGIAVRFPRIARWRKDKAIEQADSLEQLRSMVKPLSAAKSATPKPSRRQASPRHTESQADSLQPPKRLGGLFAGLDEDEDP